MRSFILAVAATAVAAISLQAQEIPDNAHRVSWGKGWECDQGYVERENACISLGEATDAEIRRYLIRRSIRSYSGSCPCPYNRDRAGRRCGGRSAYSRPGGASPLCYPRDISDAMVERIRERYSGEGGGAPQPSGVSFGIFEGFSPV